jgi:Flp pilus assembly protein TadG
MNKLQLLFKSIPTTGPSAGPLASLWVNKKGEAAVSFALVLPVLLMVSFGILEFALAMMDRHQASESLRRFSRAVAITMTADDLANIETNGTTSCTYSNLNVSCDNGSSITSWTKLIAGFQSAQDIFPRLTASNVVLIFEPTGLAPDDADVGTMALVTVQFQNLEYVAKVFPFYNNMIEKILFPTISNSLVIGG